MSCLCISASHFAVLISCEYNRALHFHVFTVVIMSFEGIPADGCEHEMMVNMRMMIFLKIS